MSTALAQAQARTVVAEAAKLGSKITIYTGSAGAVATVGYIDRVTDLFGGEITSPDARYLAVMLVQDVGEPCRGDRVTDEDGGVWTLLEEQDSDGLVADWTCEKKG